MRIHVALYYNGLLLALVGGGMVISSFVSLASDGPVSMFLLVGLVTAAVGLTPMLIIPKHSDVSFRESIFIAAFGWISCCLVGALPYYFYGSPFTFLNAMFESVSGFTSTGASILQSVEELPKGMLFWRSLTHWIGGLGIVGFAYFVLPRVGQVSRSILPQEYSGLGARTKDIARGLFMVYFGLTAAQVVFTVLAGMPFFDAVTTAFSTISTGGFSVKNLSMASYGNLSAEIVVMIFMVLAGTNFVFILSLASRPRATRSGWEIFRFYITMLGIFIVLTSIMIYGSTYQSWGEAIRYASFQIITASTATGLGSADASSWPHAAQIVITIIMIIGACSGSSAGGIKLDRILLYFKVFSIRLKCFVHPNVVPAIRLDKKAMNVENVERAVFYVSVYIAVLCLSTLALGWTGMTGVDSFTGSVACLSNVGPGLGSVGAMENYYHIPEVGKMILIFVMLLGRLEVFALILPFTPGFWR